MINRSGLRLKSDSTLHPGEIVIGFDLDQISQPATLVHRKNRVESASESIECHRRIRRSRPTKPHGAITIRYIGMERLALLP